MSPLRSGGSDENGRREVGIKSAGEHSRDLIARHRISPTWRTRLGKLLINGGVRVAGMSLAVLCTLGSIYIAAIHFGPERKLPAASTEPGCMPSHCRPKKSSFR